MHCLHFMNAHVMFLVKILNSKFDECVAFDCCTGPEQQSAAVTDSSSQKMLLQDCMSIFGSSGFDNLL